MIVWQDLPFFPLEISISLTINGRIGPIQTGVVVVQDIGFGRYKLQEFDEQVEMHNLFI